MIRACLSALLLVPLPAVAETLGQITAFIGADRLSWYTITMEQGGRTVPTASLRQGQRLSEMLVQGHPEPEFSTRGMFSVDARFLGGIAPGVVPLSVDVVHMPEGMGGPFWTSRGAAQRPVVEIVELELWGRVGQLTATFEAELCRKDKLSRPTDLADCRSVTGAIETDFFAN